MDLLVEKLDGSRYYLSQYKVLITDFEESAPSVTRNSKQLDQRNGNIDFGGWHTDKTIDVTGYYCADDMDEEEMLREKLYALLSDPDGYYITQLKTTPSVAMERPGETSGGYYDKLNNYPSHKRFLVYTEAPEMELVGNVNGTLLYKLTAEFKTMKLPYGESVPRDLDVKPITGNSAVGTNLLTNTSDLKANWNLDSRNIVDTSQTPAILHYPKTTLTSSGISIIASQQLNDGLLQPSTTYTASFYAKGTGTFRFYCYPDVGVTAGDNVTYIQLSSNFQLYTITFTTVSNLSGNKNFLLIQDYTPSDTDENTVEAYIYGLKLEKGSLATDWCPNPADPGYKKWYIDTYYNTKNLVIPYAGTVPCNQLEQGFAIEFTAKESAISISLKIDDTKLTYSGTVADGDVFMFSGFSYTKNGLSIVSKTNKAYFVLQPDKPNRITCNIHGTVRIIGFQNLYA